MINVFRKVKISSFFAVSLLGVVSLLGQGQALGQDYVGLSEAINKDYLNFKDGDQTCDRAIEIENQIISDFDTYLQPSKEENIVVPTQDGIASIDLNTFNLFSVINQLECYKTEPTYSDKINSIYNSIRKRVYDLQLKLGLDLNELASLKTFGKDPSVLKIATPSNANIPLNAYEFNLLIQELCRPGVVNRISFNALYERINNKLATVSEQQCEVKKSNLTVKGYTTALMSALNVVIRDVDYFQDYEDFNNYLSRLKCYSEYTCHMRQIWLNGLKREKLTKIQNALNHIRERASINSEVNFDKGFSNEVCIQIASPDKTSDCHYYNPPQPHPSKAPAKK